MCLFKNLLFTVLCCGEFLNESCSRWFPCFLHLVFIRLNSLKKNHFDWRWLHIFFFFEVAFFLYIYIYVIFRLTVESILFIKFFVYQFFLTNNQQLKIYTGICLKEDFSLLVEGHLLFRWLFSLLLPYHRIIQLVLQVLK